MKKRTGPTKVIVFDSDGSNPYSAELKLILEDLGLKAVLSGARDTPDVAYPLRPRFAQVRYPDFFREAASLLRVLLKHDPVVVVWARTYQKLLISTIGRRRGRRIYLVVHNPNPSRWPTGRVQAMVENLVVRRSVCLTPSSSLRDSLHRITGRSADHVVLHPPYRGWVERWVRNASDGALETDSVKGLILGRLSPDKFADFGAFLSAVENRSDLTVRALVRPAISKSGYSQTPVNFQDVSSDEWISDAELGEGLAWADILLAPYVEVTESGTVQLALSAGLPVIAFSGGALHDSLVPEALVEPDDYPGLVAAAVDAVRGAKATNRLAPAERYELCKRSWSAALNVGNEHGDN